MLSIEELCYLEDQIRDELDNCLSTVLSKFNRTGQLEELLTLLDMEYLLQNDTGYSVYKTGKIIVIGQSDVKQNVLLGVARTLGIEKNRFEFFLEYEDAKMFDFHKMQWQPSYAAIMVGPMPHSGTVKGDYSSVITALEAEDGYPPIIRLGTTGLKITKSDFRNNLMKMIQNGIIA